MFSPIRPSRFLKVRITRRGVRWAIGPRAARLHGGARALAHADRLLAWQFMALLDKTTRLTKHGCTLAARAAARVQVQGLGHALHIAYTSRPPLAAVDCDPCGIVATHPYLSPETSVPVNGVSVLVPLTVAPVVKSYGSLAVKAPAGGMLLASPPST